MVLVAGLIEVQYVRRRFVDGSFDAFAATVCLLLEDFMRLILRCSSSRSEREETRPCQ